MRYLFFVTAMSHIIIAYAQDELTATYSSDKKTIHKLSSNSASSKDGFKIKVDGINTALHSVTFEFKDFSWHSDPPEGLKVILPSFASLESVTKLEGYNRIRKVLTIIKNSKSSIQNNIASIEKTKKTLKNSLIEIARLYDYKENLGQYQIDILPEILGEINELMGRYEIMNEIGSSGDVDFLVSVKSDYEFLKKNKPLILSGLSVLAKWYAVEDSKTSKAHYPKKEFTEVPTYGKLTDGYFISLTYNFKRKKK